MTKATIGFAMCGSFCTFSKAFTQMQRLVDSGYDVIPIMSQNAFSTSTRFGKAEETVKRAEEITGKAVLHSVVQTEPIGPKKMCDLLVIAPCTGNTLAKLSLGITDTAVTMAAKSHLRTLKQDDCIKKPNSLVADFDKLEDCVTLALQGKQHQPIFL